MLGFREAMKKLEANDLSQMPALARTLGPHTRALALAHGRNNAHDHAHMCPLDS